LRELLENILPDNQVLENFGMEHDFPLIGHRKLLLNARRVADNNRPLMHAGHGGGDMSDQPNPQQLRNAAEAKLAGLPAGTTTRSAQEPAARTSGASD